MTEEGDLLSDLTDLDIVQHLLADVHDDLRGKVSRTRMLIDQGRAMGPGATILFGGEATHLAWEEARSSFVHGNFAATVLLCQGLLEHLLAAYLHGAMMMDDLPKRVQFQETARRCKECGVISDRDAADLDRLRNLRNPLSHFRHISDESSLSRRSVDDGEQAVDLLRKDAIFAIGVAVRVLSRPAFRLG